MSRIGKQPVSVPVGVEVNLTDRNIIVTGKLGKLEYPFNNTVGIDYQKQESKIFVSPKGEDKKSRSMWGLSRTLINNMIVGVSSGFTKILEINGVGYKAAVNGNILTIYLGYSHDIKYIIPSGITIKCPKPTQIDIFGFDKQLVGEVAALIRSLRKPEPYKGKGVKYSDEVIVRKVGKKK
ncbi:MAG: 50S ribosomal protein L6 [Pseudomonadota bacterium]